MATYLIVHGGATESIAIDQAAASGFVALGELDFTGDGDEYVELGNATGVAGDKLVFDAIRVVDPAGEAGAGGDRGCAAGGGAHGVGVLGVLGAAWAAARGMCGVCLRCRRRGLSEPRGMLRG